MPGVASALRISSQFTSFRNLLPRSRNSGGGLFRSPARGKFVIHHKEFLCRLGSRSPGRLRLPFAATRPQPPELARPGDHAARHARVRRRSTSELGGRGERYSHSQHDAKVADIAATAARIARPVQAGRPWARCGNIDPRVAPSGRAVGKYFLACPCLRAVAVIGWGRIAVPSVSAV
ncbi:hypothetical protein Alfi_0842 [Alistipes finegoldii DSM 17242]|jgi:hypothetical protein|uniref:Uncharacterized protein n=1 Tax=Alistipes finegoldii (strain DSM 17242 / JCM 16770 / CCUG 46020 / CIP 107999 / KCTC 15236 / AHN 2437) TaxID=679935 RepID=I3YJP6_ALIFI|nr:hypothetical protein Alfi_0842 [Alistipes finegoldii DSM 17242]